MRREFRFLVGSLVGVAFAVSLLSSAASTAWAANASGKPNIVVIVADDLGNRDLGVQGCTDCPTPHIDSLAAGGIRCTNGYVSGPYCSPTRAGLLTGRYQQRFGHEFNPGPPGEPGEEVKGLDLNQVTLADRLRAAGYATGMVGKWHLGATPQFHPTQRGFQEYFGFLGGALTYLPDRPKGKDNIYRGTEPVKETEYLTDAFAREAVAYIDRHAKEPFFLYLTFNAVHTPMEATDKYLARFAKIEDQRRRTYCAMLSAMDDAVGQVLGKLRTAGIEENTLIFFVSDNGGPSGANGSINLPLRGNKATTWEGGVRVPYLVQWKARLPQGKTYDQPVIQLDFLPTALAAAGSTTTPADKLDGVDLLPYLAGEKSGAPHAALYWRFGEQMAIRKGDWKLLRAPNDGATRGGLNREMTSGMLVNLANDIGEEHDVASANPDKARELQAAWDAWNKDNVPAKWGPAAKKKQPQPAARKRKRTA
ncbi:MAG: sulfatase [Planctomycetes bacterium]|nr:sulfatase [Planctomycetota bacterium]